MMVSVKGFLEGLIIASEKASRITRIIRAAYWTGGSDSQPIHQRIATEEKVDRKDGSSDFKTLADVLCQTVIDYELRKLFPDIKDIHGEESCSFQSCGDEEVLVKLTGNTEDTKVMLSKALSDPLVVDSISSLIHSNLELPPHIVEGISTHSTELENLSVDFSNIGVWIDPIDATKEYVNAKKSVVVDGLSHRGLGCCTVILGSYNLITGQPFVGVVSYPFNLYTCDSGNFSQSETAIHWGCYHPESSLSIVSENCIRAPSSASEMRLVLSGGEKMPFVMDNPLFERMSPKGAGNKMLAVAKGKADLYVITLESNVVFLWDTCAGHSILKAQGGGILNYRSIFEALQSYQGCLKDFPYSEFEIKYTGSHDPLSDGIIAYSDIKHVVAFFSNMLKYFNRTDDFT